MSEDQFVAQLADLEPGESRFVDGIWIVGPGSDGREIVLRHIYRMFFA